MCPSDLHFKLASQQLKIFTIPKMRGCNCQGEIGKTDQKHAISSTKEALGKKNPRHTPEKDSKSIALQSRKKIIHNKQIQEEGYLGSKLCLIILFQRAVRHHTVQSTVSAARQVTGATAAVYSNSPHEEQSDFQICLNSQQRNGKHQKQAEKSKLRKIYFFFPFSSHLLNKISVNKSTLGASNLGCVH